jgi:hypothetical protein
MAKYVHKDAYISVNGTVLSDHANQITIEDGAEEVDLTGFTAAGYREFGQGLKDVTINATFQQDFATGSVDALLSTFYSTGAAGTVVVKPTSATVSGTNPQYTLICKLFSYGPIGGAVGDAAQVECSFRHSGTAGLTRATA